MRAVPKYLVSSKLNLDEWLSPSLNFGLFFDCWNHDFSSIEKSISKNLKVLSRQKKLASKLRERQDSLLFERSRSSNAAVRFAGLSTSPFTTGLGNEHPLENGFAFFEPYGLPYLPGSSVKGVLRRAAEELVYSGHPEQAIEFSQSDIWKLFGFESSNLDVFDIPQKDVKDYVISVADDERNAAQILHSDDISTNFKTNSKLHLRGALDFWDVLIECDGLKFDVMAPHHVKYFADKQNGAVPHDSELPVPIYFLTVPAGAKFVFCVSCDIVQLKKTAPNLIEGCRWKLIVERVIDYAFECLGFGAKTSVGYGAIKRDERTENKWRDAEEQCEKREKETEGMGNLEREMYQKQMNRPNKNEPETTFLFNLIKTGEWNENKVEAAKILKRKMNDQNQWKEKSFKKDPKKDKDYQRTLEVKAWIEE